MQEALDPLSERLGREVEALLQLVQASAKLRKPKVCLHSSCLPPLSHFSGLRFCNPCPAWI